MRFREKFYRFMQGRNGVDALAKFENRLGFGFLLIALVFTVVSTILLRRELYTASTVFRILNYVCYAIGMLLMILWIWRVFSRNVSKRQIENTVYINWKQKISRLFSNIKQFRKDRKTYRYFKCPNCGQKLRAPKNIGKIRVTCSRCSNIFTTKT